MTQIKEGVDFCTSNGTVRTRRGFVLQQVESGMKIVSLYEQIDWKLEPKEHDKGHTGQVLRPRSIPL